MNFKNNILLFLICAFFGNVAFSQTKVKVVTITKSETFDWTEKTSLVVNGERAEIFITTHELPTIECTVKLISKHPDAEIAKKEVGYHQWAVDNIGKKILLRNFIEVPSGTKKPEGNLKAIYEIKIPADCELEINNYFGKIDISGTRNELVIKNDFSKIYLTDTKGEINITTKFGDVTGNQIGGKINIISNRGDISLTDISGQFDMNVSGAAVSILQQADLDVLTLIAKKSDILFDISSIKNYNIELETDQVEIVHPSWMDFKEFEEKGKKTKKKITLSPNAGDINVSLQYGKIEFVEHTGSH